MLMTLPWRHRTDEAIETPLHGVSRPASERDEALERDSDWYWKPLVLLTLLVVFSGITVSSLRDFWRWLDRPVSQVQIVGVTRHLDKQALANTLASSLDAPLFDINLKQLREQVISDPWVHDVQISRQWPPALRVKVVEEVPVARWGDKGLLNHQGDIFWPQLKPEYRSLPRLSGPAHETVQIMAMFLDLNRMFAAAGLKLTGLTLEPRGAWTIDLKNGIRVVVGREDIMPRLRRFLTIYNMRLADKADRIQQVDIRYTNGIAVQWRPEEKDSNAG